VVFLRCAQTGVGYGLCVGVFRLQAGGFGVGEECVEGEIELYSQQGWKGGYGVVFEGCRGGRKGGGGEGHEVLIEKVFGVFLGCCGDIAFYCGGRTLLDDLICSLELF